jgi:hypothetical protein
LRTTNGAFFFFFFFFFFFRALSHHADVPYSDLEKAVEDLSELLEQPIEPETIPALRQKVTDKAVYVSKRNEIMLEDTANGYLEGRWEWNSVVPGLDADAL